MLSAKSGLVQITWWTLLRRNHVLFTPSWCNTTSSHNCTGRQPAASRGGAVSIIYTVWLWLLGTSMSRHTTSWWYSKNYQQAAKWVTVVARISCHDVREVLSHTWVPIKIRRVCPDAFHHSRTARSPQDERCRGPDPPPARPFAYPIPLLWLQQHLQISLQPGLIINIYWLISSLCIMVCFLRESRLPKPSGSRCWASERFRVLGYHDHKWPPNHSGSGLQWHIQEHDKLLMCLR